MFKNKSFNVKMIDDNEKQWHVVKQPIDYDKINAIVKDQVITVGAVACAVVATKQISWALGVSISSAIRQIVDVKFPYPPFPK